MSLFKSLEGISIKSDIVTPMRDPVGGKIISMPFSALSVDNRPKIIKLIDIPDGLYSEVLF